MKIILNKEDRKSPKKILINIMLVIALIMTPLLINKSWNSYVSQFNVYQQFELSDIKLQDISNIITGNDYKKTVIKKFVNALFDTKLSNGLLGITYFTGFTLISFLILLIYKYNKEFRKKMVILGISLFIGTIGYMTMMLLLYLFSFSQTESMQLASFNRYMSSYFLGEFLLIMLIGVTIFYKDVNRITISKLLIVITISIILLDGTTLKELLPYKVIKDNKYNVCSVLGKFIMENTEENCKILVISKQRGHLQLQTHYFTEKRFFQLSWNDYLGEDYENSKIANKLFKEITEQDYIFVVDTSDKFNEQYKKYLEDGENLEKSKLYKVTYNDNKLVLSRK